MVYVTDEQRIQDYMGYSLGQLIKEMAQEMVEAQEYRHSDQHFDRTYFIVEAIDRKYGDKLQKLIEAEDGV